MTHRISAPFTGTVLQTHHVTLVGRLYFIHRQVTRFNVEKRLETVVRDAAVGAEPHGAVSQSSSLTCSRPPMSSHLMVAPRQRFLNTVGLRVPSGSFLW